MTEVNFDRICGNDKIWLRAEGHTGYAPAGQDIVCAGVSMAVQLLENCLEELGSLEEARMDDGYAELTAVGAYGYRLCHATYDVLQELQEQYPECITVFWNEIV